MACYVALWGEVGEVREVWSGLLSITIGWVCGAAWICGCAPPAALGVAASLALAQKVHDAGARVFAFPDFVEALAGLRLF